MVRYQNQLKTYVFKAAWHATSKLLKVEAKDEVEAIKKVSKRKDLKGCSKVSLLA